MTARTLEDTLTCTHATEKRRHGQVHPHRHVLQDLAMHIGKTGALLLQVRQGAVLLVQTGAITRLLIRLLAFVKEVVIQPTTFLKRGFHSRLLGRSRIQAVLESFMHRKQPDHLMDMRDSSRSQPAGFVVCCPTPILPTHSIRHKGLKPLKHVKPIATRQPGLRAIFITLKEEGLEQEALRYDRIDPALEARVDELLGRMTLVETVGQVVQVTPPRQDVLCEEFANDA
jgi:hypothetical protein